MAQVTERRPYPLNWQMQDYHQDLGRFIKHYICDHGTSILAVAKEMSLTQPTLKKFLLCQGMQHPLTVFRIQDWVDKKKSEEGKQLEIKLKD